MALMRLAIYLFLSLTLWGLNASYAYAQDTTEQDTTEVEAEDFTPLRDHLSQSTPDNAKDKPKLKVISIQEAEEMGLVFTSADTTEPGQVSNEAIDKAEVQQAFRRMKRDANAQWELRTDLPERPKPPGWADAVARFFGRLIEFLTPLFKVIFWVGLAVFGLIFLYAIFTSLRGIIQDRGGETAEEIVPEYRPSAKAAQILLGDADALAAEGRYAEAIHLILYRSIQDIEKARPQAIRLSLTSREIARSEALGPQTRTIFAGIARFVERSHFGGRAVDAEDYASARSLYAQLTTAPAPSKAESPITNGPALGAAS